MHMIRDGARSGYYVPWTRVVSGEKNKIANLGNNVLGRRTGWWGSEGLGANVIRTDIAMQETFEREGIRRFGKASARAAATVARDMEGQLVGRAYARTGSIKAAQRYASKYAGVYGARAATAGGARYLAGRIAGLAIPVVNLLTFGSIAVGAASGLWGFISKTFGRPNYLEMGGNFQDSQAGYTSRQRALQAITSSSMQARSAIGNEAMLFHRG